MLPLVRASLAAPSEHALRDRVVLVTGANGGLGRACALNCAKAGASVVLVGRKVRALEDLYDEIEMAGGARPAIYPMDFEGATPDDYASLSEAIRLQCGRLDAIIHAAVLFDGLRPLDQVKPIDWLRIQQVNVNAPFLLTQACLPLLRDREDSSVIFVLDDPQRVGKAYWGGYGVAKCALAGYASILHNESDAGPLRVHALVPPPMRTTLRRMAYFGENTLDHELPDPVAAAVAFLVTGNARELRGMTLDLRPTG
ncbi:MAG TPA: SDR family NAD(P)-dependent oxidoreductase [Dokdonella sp.]|uniref:SDR family NAD(P)-dependent oxidoreductase n=1 Tax=Dokdonella sp. TaxID=2291710 RepID=UPI002C313263|nr:SDR family NAD(P)-dependent oxidoreductase [Dokdonella sp.]HOX72720.1 SDR family NAD(P)-dependent oxidoreductase [Dokdonella sp.]HPG93687.1 SDR family NAD(P)-dependent oxidoreductase [Dokdonella sp.]